MATTVATPAPHSWDLAHWPDHVYPHGAAKARWIIRVHKDELVLAGAMCRIGRELVFFGTEYTRWLQSKRPQVMDFVPNLPPRGTKPKRGAPEDAAA
jgi:hypothetical protein